ncbi:MAG: hypothetical protein PHY40_03695 [Patescibacteria group bacterium]|nr:hypothetical protein [Patescibacteria group bacterium]
MNRKLFGILIIAIAAVIIALIVYFIFFYNFNQSSTTAPVATTTQAQLPQATTSNTVIKPAVTAPSASFSFENRELNEEDLKIMAAAFAERFGSFSNQSNYSNINDLKIFMTQNMQSWADQYIAKSQGEFSTIYHGYTTKSVATEATSFDASSGKSEILVKTQRRESSGTMENSSVFYQDILITFKKERNAWKVDSAVWQEKK